MKIAGTYTLPFPLQQSYDLMQNPDALSRAIPGCESLEAAGPGEYKMKMKMALASISGSFDGKVRLADPDPPSSFRLVVEGSGKIGFMKGDGLLKLKPAADGAEKTEVDYEGDVQVGGTIAAVGQRLIDTTAKMLIKKFFDRLSTSNSGPGS